MVIICVMLVVILLVILVVILVVFLVVIFDFVDGLLVLGTTRFLIVLDCNLGDLYDLCGDLKKTSW